MDGHFRGGSFECDSCTGKRHSRRSIQSLSDALRELREESEKQYAL